MRGIEKRKIFLDDTDRHLFVNRLGNLLTSTDTECLAWALIPNHFHLLLRSGSGGLASFMRRLLTGYAITFNKRHNRVGHLFQNRYKSIVCEEEPYLLELVRYIHLNPLRARIVKGMAELDHYPWSGHAVIMGNQQLEGEATEEVLAYFGKRKKTAISKYRQFVEDGIVLGRRNDLIGGGWRRSRGYIADGEQVESFDERVLGSGDFVEYLRKEKNLHDRLLTGMSIHQLVERVADYFGLPADLLKRNSRMPTIVQARGVVCYLAVRELEMSGTAVGAVLNMKRSGVCLAARRGERVVEENPDIRARVFC
ncbi:helix-turn-helix domain-containing protein [Geobacter sp.]|uniref:helix-turn-helix domain-containing protein n=1 Tax=Geobacter sp. TaxID=46610 RepID=UPI0026148F1C|nr:helix-turn-helix domain-containing protein [Geobacter sp.]